MLKATLFSNYLLPGIILFCINGLGQAAAGILTLRRDPRAGIMGIIETSFAFFIDRMLRAK